MHKKFLNKIGRFAILGLMPALFSSGCKNFDPAYNEPVEVYGPPEMFEDNISDDEDSSKDLTPSEEAPDSATDSSDLSLSFDPSLNMEIEIYGPPDMFEDTDKDQNTDEAPSDGK